MTEYVVTYRVRQPADQSVRLMTDTASGYATPNDVRDMWAKQWPWRIITDIQVGRAKPEHSGRY